jgi:hypothetical protein
LQFLALRVGPPQLLAQVGDERGVSLGIHHVLIVGPIAGRVEATTVVDRAVFDDP